MNRVSWVKDSLLLAAEDVLQAEMRKDWPESRLSFNRWDGKSLIVARDKLLQDGICLIHVGCASETEFDHKSLLEGFEMHAQCVLWLEENGCRCG